ncbi:ArnT family glycosyltransferase [uncultured Sphingomonas sp.]|uniref:ArnT family glycosyltransferase n=1 Tax=uncultured Sphingomonas sp. TaxID=158754 RepID=UPI0035C9FFD2
MAERARGIALSALLIAVAVALRARDFGNPVIHVDEQFYLLVGDRMRHGALPYVDIWDRKPVGLFLIFAAIRMLPGEGILAYQLVATLFAAATAWLIAQAGRRLGAGSSGAVVAAVAYLLWLSLLSGRGGQSPVFYNLFVAGAGLLTLRLPGLAARRDRRGIVVNGAVACLLAGLAIQTKYTPVVEGAFFGLAHSWYLRRAGGGWPVMVGAALLWAILGIAPTAIVVADYWRRGPAFFQAFWFANFASVALRKGYPAAKIAARLAGTTTQLLPFIVMAVMAWRARPRCPEILLAFGWLAAALIAFAMIGAFFDHYALPLMVPLTIVAAPVLGRYRAAMLATLGWGVLLLAFHVATEPDDRVAARAVARAMAANSGRECPYVFAGDAILYHLADACLPTAYAFPSTLAYSPEQGATGIDEAAEVRRVMARRPPVVVTMDHPLAPWNRDSQAVMTAALARDYRLLLSAPRGRDHWLVFLRRDRRPAR